MWSLLPVLLLALLGGSQGAGPEPKPSLILQVQLMGPPRASAPLDSSSLGLLSKLCFLLHLPSGTSVTLHPKGPSGHLTC